MKKEEVATEFVPFRLIPIPEEERSSSTRLSVTATLKGGAADEFEALQQEYGLNRSQLLVQMVYHCLGKSKELKDFYTRLQILAK